MLQAGNFQVCMRLSFQACLREGGREGNFEARCERELELIEKKSETLSLHKHDSIVASWKSIAEVMGLNLVEAT